MAGAEHAGECWCCGQLSPMPIWRSCDMLGYACIHCKQCCLADLLPVLPVLVLPAVGAAGADTDPRLSRSHLPPNKLEPPARHRARRDHHRSYSIMGMPMVCVVQLFKWS